MPTLVLILLLAMQKPQMQRKLVLITMESRSMEELIHSQAMLKHQVVKQRLISRVMVLTTLSKSILKKVFLLQSTQTRV